MSDVRELVDHLFRHRAGQMVSTLTRILGPEQLPLAEEVVQEALIAALSRWTFHEIPDNPAGWLFRVARNKALDQLRQETSFRAREAEIAAALQKIAIDDDAHFAHELRDDVLRMMLMCRHPAIPEESRVPLTLKTVGGFSVDEIASALLVPDTAIAQRIVRAKRMIREKGIPISMPSREELPERMASLLKILYLMFNEGYNAHAGEALVRADLCDEAIRLTRQLVEQPATETPAVHALLSLMLLQAGRLPARVDGAGEVALLADQDRALWNGRMIAEGISQLDASAIGHELSTYHIEAAIAACHASAPSFEETNWTYILELYDQLLELQPSPVVALNRTVAIAMSAGPVAGLAALESVETEVLQSYPQFHSVRGELRLRAGDPVGASESFEQALRLPSTMPEKRFLLRKLAECRA